MFFKVVKLENEIDEKWNFNTVSEFMIAWMYEHGLGVDKNIYKAIELYIKLAEQNMMLAQYRLGYIYEHGNGVKKDEREAGYWSSKIGSEENIKKCKEFMNKIKTGKIK